MKISELIKVLQQAKKQHGDVEVVMDIYNTNTTNDWNGIDNPCIIGIHDELEFEKVQFYDADLDKVMKRKVKVVKLLPDFIC